MAEVKPIVIDGNRKRQFNALTDTLPGGGVPDKICAMVTTSPFTVTNEDRLLVDTDLFGADMIILLPTSASRKIGILCQPLMVRHIGKNILARTVFVRPFGLEEIDGDNVDFGIDPGDADMLDPDGIIGWWATT